MAEIKNARIVSTMLGREDHGIATFEIFVKFSGGGVGIGGFALDAPPSGREGERKCSGKSLDIILKILDVVGVTKWEDLPGKYIRFMDEGWGSTIEKIGNIIDDKWIDLRREFSSIEE